MTRRPGYLFYQWLWTSLDLMYPPVCGGCARRGARWCEDCQKRVQCIHPPYCERCGQVTGGVGLCENCRSAQPRFVAVRSWGVFEGPLRQAIHRLKYYRDVSLGERLARPLIQQLSELGWMVDVVLPVPLGVARLKERGYNQASLLARPLALGCGLDFRPQALGRVRETRSQVGLSFAQRRENVSGAFQAWAGWVAGQSVLVVDDVATSSATLDACASALLQGGARQVYGLTLARAGSQASGATQTSHSA